MDFCDVTHDFFVNGHFLVIDRCCYIKYMYLVQLLNQLESSGPPPAENEKIEALPTVTISQQQVGECVCECVLLCRSL